MPVFMVKLAEVVEKGEEEGFKRGRYISRVSFYVE